MKLLRSILLFPLALIRFVLAIVITIYYVSVGFIKLKKKGFSRDLQKWVMGSWGSSILWSLGVEGRYFRFSIIPTLYPDAEPPELHRHPFGGQISSGYDGWENGGWQMAHGANRCKNHETHSC
jgi:hypothetical protein